MFCYLYIALFFFAGCECGFLRIPMGRPFLISSREVSIPIKGGPDVFNKINGFYGLIGPDINMTNVGSLYDLFTGDGMIQGVFLHDGNITFVKHFIRTEKLTYEEENGRIPGPASLLFTMLNKVGLLPNTMGMANTALLQVRNRVYALFERDVPYHIDFDFENTSIQTIQKIDIPKIPHFSGHSKYDGCTIETIDYNIMKKRLSYFQLNENFEIIKQVDIRTSNIPIIHDFYSDAKKVILIDSPLTLALGKQIPILLNKNKATVIHVLNKETGVLEKYYLQHGIYLFHFAKVVETDRYIEIYASLYESLDFERMDIRGCYRKIVLDKESRIGKIDSVLETDYYNLDFPIRIDENLVVLRSIKGMKIDSFVVMNGVNIVHKIGFQDRSICGEPAIKKIDGIPHLLCFAFDSKQGYFIVINMNTYEQSEISLPVDLTIGFHSLFIENLA